MSKQTIFCKIHQISVNHFYCDKCKKFLREDQIIRQDPMSGSYVDFEESKEFTFDIQFYEHTFTTTRRLCKFCQDHHLSLQSDGNLPNVSDCKNVFVKDGKVMGQCCCYTENHR